MKTIEHATDKLYVNKNISLFEFIEVLDDLMDYDNIKSTLDMSYTEIGYAILKLKELAAAYDKELITEILISESAD